MFALKNVLVIYIKTSQGLVYGETDRFLLTLNSIFKCIRYWLQLTNTGEDILVRNAYLILYNLDARRNLASNVRMQLFQKKFGFAWMNQSV